MTVKEKLAELGIGLPEPATPIASYLPYVEVNGMLYVSGQLPFRKDGSLICGRLGETLDVSDGAEAARACGVMLLAQASAALGELERVKGIVKLGVYVNSVAGLGPRNRAGIALVG